MAPLQTTLCLLAVLFPISISSTARPVEPCSGCFAVGGGVVVDHDESPLGDIWVDAQLVVGLSSGSCEIPDGVTICKKNTVSRDGDRELQRLGPLYVFLVP